MIFGVAAFGTAAFSAISMAEIVAPVPSVSFGGWNARENFGLLVEQATGWRDVPARQWPTAAIPLRQGLTRQAAAAAESTRELRIAGHVKGDTVVDARAKLDALALALERDPVLLRFPDNPTRYVSAQLTRGVTTPAGPQFIQRILPVELMFTAFDPYFYDDYPSLIALSTGGTRLSLGTAPSRPVITIRGPATNPLATFRDSNGVTIQTLGLTITLIASDTLVVDCDALTIRLNGVTSRIDALTSGDFLTMDPVLAGQQPTLALSSGTGEATYRRAWR